MVGPRNLELMGEYAPKQKVPGLEGKGKGKVCRNVQWAFGGVRRVIPE